MNLEGAPTMTDDTTPSDATQPAQPDADLKSLEPLVGTWRLAGDTTGEVRYEWLEGEFFLLQHVNMELFSHAVKGIEVIGRLRPFGEEPSKDVVSRAYSSTGDTFDYVYELKDNTLTIWGGRRGSPAHYQGTFNAEGRVCTGAWVYLDGDYISTMTKVAQEEE
jgi:hypothetical protein